MADVVEIGLAFWLLLAPRSPRGRLVREIG
jgi:hypothetical protein